MQFLIDRDRLLEVLSKLAGVIDGKSGVPILKNVFVDAGASAILLRTTDTDMQLLMPCPAEVTTPGQITVEGKLLHEIVRLCPKAGQIGVTLGGTPKRRKPSPDDASKLRLTSGKAEFSLLTLPPDDWPMMAIAFDAAEFRLECRQLRALLEKTRFAVSTDEHAWRSRPCRSRPAPMICPRRGAPETIPARVPLLTGLPACAA
jgi:DNA polymerase-3 subunit beta